MRTAPNRSWHGRELEDVLGPILWSEIYDGESYDARREQAGWSSAGYDDSTWEPVQTLEHRKDILVAPAGPPIRRTGEIRPVAILHTSAGDTVYDMGQNLVGWVRLRAQGDPARHHPPPRRGARQAGQLLHA